MFEEDPARWATTRVRNGFRSELPRRLYESAQKHGYPDAPDPYNVGPDAWRTRTWFKFYAPEHPRSTSSLRTDEEMCRTHDFYPVFSTALINAFYDLDCAWGTRKGSRRRHTISDDTRALLESGLGGQNTKVLFVIVTKSARRVEIDRLLADAAMPAPDPCFGNGVVEILRFFR
jgi:hypothetical protein